MGYRSIHEMVGKGFQIGYRKVGYLLEEMGYSLQKNQKMNQVGEEHPDRDAQFNHINEKVKAFGAEEYPVISIDCKKKELVGNFQNVGQEYAPKKHPVKVLDHDFPLPGLGKAAPYGIYDISANEGSLIPMRAYTGYRCAVAADLNGVNSGGVQHSADFYAVIPVKSSEGEIARIDLHCDME